MREFIIIFGLVVIATSPFHLFMLWKLTQSKPGYLTPPVGRRADKKLPPKDRQHVPPPPPPPPKKIRVRYVAIVPYVPRTIEVEDDDE